jgi:23S rRNA (uridine2552-2'-O)-methyltransferase
MAKRVLHDEYFLKAKAEGYLARSAYKLKEIQERSRLIKRGDRVLDLGCAPGAWLQVAGEIVGPKGRVAGIDLTPTDFAFAPMITPLVGDIYKTEPAVLLAAAGLEAGITVQKFDVVLSDMAPNTTGHGDHFLSVRLCRRMLELLPALLRPGGNACYKVFEGEEYPALLKETAAMFRTAKGFKPKASRDVSVEMYVLAAGYTPPRS